MDRLSTYQGMALNGIDAKLRVAIPAPLRATLDGNGSPKEFVLAFHPDQAPCLVGSDQSWMHQRQAEILESRALAREKSEVFALDRHKVSNFALTETLPYDASGRFILPKAYRRWAGLEDLALFVGSMECFQIWNPIRFLHSDFADAGARFLVEDMLEERGVIL